MSLKDTLARLEKTYGKGTVLRLGDNDPVPVEVVSTGVVSLDAALGIGGYPRGRVVEIYGTESGGKTTLTLQAIAEVQKAGGKAGFIDAEHALDVKYAKALGVNTDDLYVSQPDSGEQALEVAEGFIKSGEIDIVIVDSVAALVPRAELEGDMGDSLPGLQARLMSQAMRKLTAAVSRSKTILIFINQIRSKIGVMFGSPETTTGGNALKFYASVRLDVRRISTIKDGETAVGARTRIKVTKNKCCAPFKEAEVDLLYGTGFSRENDLLDLGVKYGVVERSGAWLSLNNERLGQGREKARIFLLENPKICDILYKGVMEKISAPTAVHT
jgi:recombination protein RecA